MRQSIAYTRVSSREQQQEGFSLEAQSKALSDYADRCKFNVLKMFEDVETAKKSGRTQFDEMVQWLKRNRSCRVLLVEKTDRLYRNLKDAVTLEELDIEIHLVKEGQIISKDSKSQAKLMHGLNLVLAKHYSDNLREEVKKGMHEKASQGVYPGHAPFGYRNNKGERTIEVDPECSPMTAEMFKLYATGQHTLSTLRSVLKTKYGKVMSLSNLHLILRNKFYIGIFEWSGQSFSGTHPLFVEPKTFVRVQSVMDGHNRPKYSKRDVALRGLLVCANDGCQLTGDVQKEKYVYYRCTGYKGKCDLPRFREADLSERLGEPLKHLQVPPEIVERVVAMLKQDDANAASKLDAERARLESRLKAVRNRIDSAYLDKLDGKISEEFWERKTNDWQGEEQQVSMAIQAVGGGDTAGRVLSAEKAFELANKAHSLYLSQDSHEKAKLLRMLVSKFEVGALSVKPTYVYPFDVIYERAKAAKWSGREDSNLRPPGPEPGALPDCATPRSCC